MIENKTNKISQMTLVMVCKKNQEKIRVMSDVKPNSLSTYLAFCMTMNFNLYIIYNIYVIERHFICFNVRNISLKLVILASSFVILAQLKFKEK